MIVRLGLDPKTVADAGRWSDIANLFKTYTHSDGTMIKILDAIRTSRVQFEKLLELNPLKYKRGS